MSEKSTKQKPGHIDKTICSHVDDKCSSSNNDQKSGLLSHSRRQSSVIVTSRASFRLSQNVPRRQDGGAGNDRVVKRTRSLSVRPAGSRNRPVLPSEDCESKTKVDKAASIRPVTAAAVNKPEMVNLAMKETKPSSLNVQPKGSLLAPAPFRCGFIQQTGHPDKNRQVAAVTAGQLKKDTWHSDLKNNVAPSGVVLCSESSLDQVLEIPDLRTIRIPQPTAVNLLACDPPRTAVSELPSGDSDDSQGEQTIEPQLTTPVGTCRSSGGLAEILAAAVNDRLSKEAEATAVSPPALCQCTAVRGLYCTVLLCKPLLGL